MEGAGPVLEGALPADAAHEVIALKRSLWAQEGAAQEYQYEAYKPAPLTRLKNLTEIGFVARHIRGPLVLDAGAGTGRFTHPLRQRGLSVFPLDISREMLREGRSRALKLGTGFPCLRGEIERLPFGDDTFDSMVSITVLRHFPNWRSILAEYVRVVRPGGRLVFECVSGDQRSFLRRVYGGGEADESASRPNDYQASVGVRDLEALGRELGAAVQVVAPYDFFNENALLKAVLGREYDAFMARVLPLLETQGGIGLYECVCRRILPALSPAISDAWLVVLEKGGVESGRSYRSVDMPQMRPQLEQGLLALVSACLGHEGFDAAMKELSPLSSLPGASELLELCRRELLPRFPFEAVHWD